MKIYKDCCDFFMDVNDTTRLHNKKQLGDVDFGCNNNNNKKATIKGNNKVESK